LKIFGSRQYYRHELSRSTFKEAQILEAMGTPEDAARTYQKAYEVRQDLYPDERRSLSEVTEEMYDRAVIFWSR